MLRVSLRIRRPYTLIRCNSAVTSNEQQQATVALDEIDQAKSIRELRELKARLENPASFDPSEEASGESEQLGYIHMKDERLAFVDPERENYVVSRMNPGMGDMDPETRQGFNFWVFF